MTFAPNTARAARVVDSMQLLATLVGGLRRIPSVSKVVLGPEGQTTDLWVLLSDENLDDMERVYLVERDVRRRADVFPLEVHVLTLNRVSDSSIPAVTTSNVLFERANERVLEVAAPAAAATA